MTKEEINNKALEAYPVMRHPDLNVDDYYQEEREGYIQALTEIEGLPKFHGWMARDEDGELTIFSKKPIRSEYYNNSWVAAAEAPGFHEDDFWLDIKKERFPDLTWDDEPVEVELLIRKI